LPISQLFGEFHSGSDSNLELVTPVPASRAEGNRVWIAFSRGFDAYTIQPPEIWLNSGLNLVGRSSQQTPARPKMCKKWHKWKT